MFARALLDVTAVMDASRAMSQRAVNSDAWLYTNDSMMIRVVERTADGDQIEVTADGPPALRGRHLFASRVEATAFRLLLDRQLVAAGFAVMTHSDCRHLGAT
jgi:hypothetical protein